VPAAAESAVEGQRPRLAPASTRLPDQPQDQGDQHEVQGQETDVLQQGGGLRAGSRVSKMPPIPVARAAMMMLTARHPAAAA
jgi:hypothetical protein